MKTTSKGTRVQLVCIFAIIGSACALQDIDYFPRQAGYRSEVHSVPCTDGESITFIRMPPENKSKGVLYLQHGLFDSSNTWLLNGEDSLGFLLHREGYDVWMGNSRGNEYSPVKDYGFTWDDSARLDLPAAIDYITKTAGEKPVYIGHSQGTAMMFAALSEGWVKPESLAGYAALGPIAYLKHQQSPLFTAMGKLHTDKILKPLAGKPLTMTLDFVKRFIESKHLRYDWFSLLFGKSQNLSDSNWHGFFPMQTSANNVGHWAQMARTGEFQMYYGGFNPFHDYELYNIRSIPAGSIKIALFIGNNDLLTATEDSDRLIQDLRSKQLLQIVKQYPGYAHMDFTWARKGGPQPLYNEILQVLENFRRETGTLV